MGKAMFTIVAAMAELERSVIRERVIAGMEYAREAQWCECWRSESNPATQRYLPRLQSQQQRSKISRRRFGAAVTDRIGDSSPRRGNLDQEPHPNRSHLPARDIRVNDSLFDFGLTCGYIESNRTF